MLRRRSTICSACPRRSRSWRFGQRVDALEDGLFGLLGQSAHGPQTPILCGGPELVERPDPECLVDEPDGARPETGTWEHLHERRRDLRTELVVEAHPTGLDKLGDLVADGLADARDAGWRTAAIGVRDVDRAVGEASAAR